jgi:hypothetical protein
MAVPVFMLAKRSPLMVSLVAIWGLFLGTTTVGQDVAQVLNEFGSAMMTALG